ncbi:PIN2/TERF1-interacting telomerase inhibitor 1 isoform X1 [Pogona vitticeps]
MAAGAIRRDGRRRRPPAKMAMLAEPRRKQKWSVDPRNTTWSKDDSKFGQKMLEKMGWSKGKGLGAQEQGNPEHIRVQVKNNTLGLGAPASQGDNWIAHQDDFNQLLAELNNCHGQEIPEAAPKEEEKKTFSLEEKSKTSRKRVHYVKFAKGKDLSNRSEEDLSCIFGKRQSNKKQVGGAKATALEEAPKEKEEPDEELPEQVEAGNTVTSTLTVQEYFAKRMAKLKKGQPRVDSGSAVPPSMAMETSVGLESQPKKKKSRKHVEPESESQPEPGDLEMLDSSGGEVGVLEAQKKRKKKKEKKRKKPKHTSLDPKQSYNKSPKSTQEKKVVYSRASDAENNEAEGPQSKKKDMKKCKKRGRDTAEGVQRPKRRDVPANRSPQTF